MIRNRTLQQGHDQVVIEGIRKDLQHIPTLYLAGEEFTPATLEARIQARVDAASAILVARAAWEQSVARYVALDAPTRVVLRDLKQHVIAMFGEASPALSDFGFAPRKPPTMTEAQKAAAVARRAATRKARGTLGRKARLKISGAAPPAEGQS